MGWNATGFHQLPKDFDFFFCCCCYQKLAVRYKVRYLLIQYPFLCTFEQLKTLSRPHLNVLGAHQFSFFLYEEGSHRGYMEVKSSLSFPFWFVSLSLCFPARFDHKEELTSIQWNLGYLIDVHLSITIKLQ